MHSHSCHPLARTLFTVVLLSTWVACGPPPPVQHPSETATEETPEVIEVEPELYVTNDDGTMSALSPAQLFERAGRMLHRKRYDKAAEYYDMLWQNLDEASPYTLPSLYNAGLSYERLGEYETAQARYARVLELAPAGSEDAIDATFRLAESYGYLKKWHEVVRVMGAFIEQEGIKNPVRTEAHYRLGFAQLALNQVDAAEETFKSGLFLNRTAGRSTLADDHYFVAGAEYGLALVLHARFSNIKLRQPALVMKRALEKKKQLSFKAFNQYNRVIVFGHSYWAILSGYQAGKLMEDYYYDLLAAEIPEGTTDAELEQYFVDMRKELKPFLEEALEVYEATYAIAQGTNEQDNPWVQESYERLQRLKTYFDNEEEQRREEEIILELSKQIQAHPEIGLPPNPDLALPVPKAAAPE